jgi:hypothetical protein
MQILEGKEEGNRRKKDHGFLENFILVVPQSILKVFSKGFLLSEQVRRCVCLISNE